MISFFSVFIPSPQYSVNKDFRSRTFWVETPSRHGRTFYGAREGRVSGVSWPDSPPPKSLSWGQKLHVAFMSDMCQSNGNGHLSNFNTLETTCLHSHTKILWPVVRSVTSHVLCIKLHDKTWLFPVEKWFPRAWDFALLWPLASRRFNKCHDLISRHFNGNKC